MGQGDDLNEQQETTGLIVFEMHGFNWVAHEEVDGTRHGDFTAWEISELSTGFRIPFPEPCFDLEQAITRAKKFVYEKGMPATAQAMSRARRILQEKV